MIEPATAQTRLVPSVTQAAAILRLLGKGEDALGVSAIARRVGVSPSSCFNILKTLVEEDLVGFDPTTKRYAIGLGVVRLARQALSRDAVLIAARPTMQQIAGEIDAAVALWRVTSGDRLTLITLAEGESAARIHMAVGQRQPIGGGATGRAVLGAAGVTGAALRTVFDVVRWQSPPDFSRYAEDVAAVRVGGYAVDVDHMFRGITTIAAAVVGAGQRADYCLSISLFSRRHGEGEIRDIGRQLASAAAKIALEVFGPAQ